LVWLLPLSIVALIGGGLIVVSLSTRTKANGSTLSPTSTVVATAPTQIVVPPPPPPSVSTVSTPPSASSVTATPPKPPPPRPNNPNPPGTSPLDRPNLVQGKSP